MQLFKFIIKVIYYSLYDLVKCLINLKQCFNFIILTPRLISIIIKKVIIFEKKNKKIFIQNIRDYSDILTVYEVFSEESYNLQKFKIYEEISSELKSNYDLKKKSLIIDCGSNIGSSSTYFSKLYNNSSIVSIEPNNESFLFSKKNLFVNNLFHFNNAVSNIEQTIGFFSDTNDNRASKIKHDSKEKIKCLSVNQILENFVSNEFYYFIIKIDIEGYENKLFENNFDWIDKFKVIIIEIHDWMMPSQSNSHNFCCALTDTIKKYKKRDLLISGENLISVRIDD